MDVLEVLKRAEASLDSDAPFKFSDWGVCACGHLYSAATGRALVERDKVGSAQAYLAPVSSDPDYLAAIGAVLSEHVKRNGGSVVVSPHVLSGVILNYGSSYDGIRRDEARRAYTLDLVRAAIRTIEDAQMEVMLKVADGIEREPVEVLA